MPIGVYPERGFAISRTISSPALPAPMTSTSRPIANGAARSNAMRVRALAVSRNSPVRIRSSATMPRGTGVRAPRAMPGVGQMKNTA